MQRGIRKRQGGVLRSGACHSNTTHTYQRTQGDKLLEALQFSGPERLGANLERNQKCAASACHTVTHRGRRITYAVLAGASLGGASFADKVS